MDVASDVVELFLTRTRTALPNSPPSSSASTESAATWKPPRSPPSKPSSHPTANCCRPPPRHRRRWLAPRRHRHPRLARRRAHRQAGLVISIEDGPMAESPTAPAAPSTASCSSPPSNPARLFTRFGGTPSPWASRSPRKPTELKRRLRMYADEHLAAREPERLLRIHAELPSTASRRARRMAQKLEPLGHSNPEPLPRPQRAPAQSAAHHEASSSPRTRARPIGAIHPAVRWLLQFVARRIVGSSIRQPRTPQLHSRRRLEPRRARHGTPPRAAAASTLPIASRNDHPDFGGLEIEIMGMQLAGA